jgi:hypothetical protein
VRLREADGMWVAEEADRRGVDPSVVIEALVTHARRAASADKPIKMQPADQDTARGNEASD